MKRRFAFFLVSALLAGSAIAAPTISGVSRNIEFPAPGDAVETSVTVTGTNVSAVNLYVDTGSGFASTAMTDNGSGVYTAAIPGSAALADGTYVKYYYEATDDTGTGTFPATAPTDFGVYVIDSDPALASDLVINEIMYDPTGGDNAAPSATAQSEWVEIYNRRATPVRLDYYRFAKSGDLGSAVVFPENTTIDANSYVVVAGRLDTFTNIFGTLSVPTFDWGRSGSYLTNGNSTVILTHPNTVLVEGDNGTPFDSVHYYNGAPWPGGDANNGGPSIELTNPALDNNLGANWKVATSDLITGKIRGTPGKQNSTYEDFSISVAQVVRDIQYPTTTDTITISAKVVGPNPISTVKLMADLRDGAGFHEIADMNTSGPDTYAATIGPFPDNTDVKYYVEATDNAAATATGPDGAPGNFLVFEVANDPIGADDVLINEVMYDPAGADNTAKSEWVELYNLTGSDLDLSFFQFSPRTTGFSQVTIPEGTTITAHGFLVLAGSKSLFLADYPDGTFSYNIDPDKVVDCGWPTGSIMTNSGDTPNLRHVNAIGYTGSANAAFDSVAYLGDGTWPAVTADNGQSLELKLPTLDNSQGANWTLSDLTTAPFGTPQANNSTIPAAVSDWAVY